MTGTKSIYHKKTIQLCLVKVVLFFSVCAFSGFSGQVQSIHPQSVRTELLEARRNKDSSFKLFQFQQNLDETSHTKLRLNLVLYNHPWNLLNFSRSLAIEYKSICKKSFSYKYSYIQLPTKILSPSPEDEMPSFSLI